jgi:hypothetical protein
LILLLLLDTQGCGRASNPGLTFAKAIGVSVACESRGKVAAIQTERSDK